MTLSKTKAYSSPFEFLVLKFYSSAVNGVPIHTTIKKRSRIKLQSLKLNEMACIKEERGMRRLRRMEFLSEALSYFFPFEVVKGLIQSSAASVV